MRRQWRLGLGLALVALVTAVGAAWYSLVEGFSLVEAVYQSVITVSTVGFGEVQPLDQSGRLFTIGLIIVGVGAIGFALAGVVELLVESAMNRIAVRRRERSLDRLSDHVVVCGYGRIGKSVIRLLGENQQVGVIEVDPDVCVIAERDNVTIIEGDSTNDVALLRAGLDRAATLIVCLGRDSDAISTVLSARSLHPSLRIISRANEQQSINKLRLAGADQVVSPIDMAAQRLASDALHPELSRFMDAAVDRDMPDLTIRAIAMKQPRSCASTELAQFEQSSGARVIGLQDSDGHNFDRTSFDQVADATLIVVGSLVEVDRFEALLTGER